VVVLVPIALGMPAVLVFIPPPMPLTPATLAHVVEFATLVVGLLAVASVLLDCLVEFMFRVRHPPLTSVEVFCVKPRCGSAKQNREENAY